MINVVLKDGKELPVPAGSTALDVATQISPGLAKRAVAAMVNGELRDLSREVPAGASVDVVRREDAAALELLRHDAAHVMAQAVQELFPGTQVTIGPTIEDGFYYDFLPPSNFTPDDLPRIEERMKEIVDRDLSITREVWSRDDATAHFESIGEHYKAELIRAIPAGEDVTMYRQGEWMDLCRGPHLPSTAALGKHFRLTRIAGAYWRGDSQNQMLQRIYGTCWATKKELDGYFRRLEEAAKRDHRLLGQNMDLFHLQPEAPGAVFWHPRGTTLFRVLEEYMRRKQRAAGYQEIITPELIDRSLWEKSGHWEKFGDNMFTSEVADERTFALKPMNCPGCVQVYKQGIHSYRDLPVRLGEFGYVHRFEPSGTLHGLMRVRAFTQDDAHVFCTLDQLEDECVKLCHLIPKIYKDFGFDEVEIALSDRPEVRIGGDDAWTQSEEALRSSLKAAGMDYTLNPGEGAFYGPKLEFTLKDAIGRRWQCGTVQVDLNLAARLDATYTSRDDTKEHPVIIHRALFGSMERFIGILLEHYEGRLPLWLAPTQAVVATITDAADPWARVVHDTLLEAGLRTEMDLRNEKIGYKVREHSAKKVSRILCIGETEANSQSVSMRTLGSKELKTMTLDEAVTLLSEQALPPS